MAGRRIEPTYRFHKKTGKAIVTYYSSDGQRRSKLLQETSENKRGQPKVERLWDAYSARRTNGMTWTRPCRSLPRTSFGWSHRGSAKGNAGSPKMVQDHGFIFSDAKLVAQPGILFWQNRDQCFARRLDQDQWDKFT